MDAPNWQKVSSESCRSPLYMLCWHIKILPTIASFCEKRKVYSVIMYLRHLHQTMFTACRKPSVVAICWAFPELTSFNEYNDTAFPSCLPCRTNKLHSQLIHERGWFLSVYTHSSAGEKMLGLVGIRRFIAMFINLCQRTISRAI